MTISISYLTQTRARTYFSNLTLRRSRKIFFLKVPFGGPSLPNYHFKFAAISLALWLKKKIGTILSQVQKQQRSELCLETHLVLLLLRGRLHDNITPGTQAILRIAKCLWLTAAKLQKSGSHHCKEMCLYQTPSIVWTYRFVRIIFRHCWIVGIINGLIDRLTDQPSCSWRNEGDE